LGVPVVANAPAPESAPVMPAPAPAPIPAPAPVKREETEKPSLVAAPAAEKAGDEELERVRDISEAVGRLDGTNRGLASFLMSSEAYVSKDGKRLVLRTEPFAAMMFKSEEAKSAVAKAFALAKITDGVAATVTVETIKAGEKKKSAADDLSGWL